MNTSPDFVYISFILPALFSLSLIAEGLYKIKRSEDGYFPFALGIIFLIGIISAYFIFFH